MRIIPSRVHGGDSWSRGREGAAWGGALNHLFGIVPRGNVARKETCERRPIHTSKVASRSGFRRSLRGTPSWQGSGSPGSHAVRSPNSSSHSLRIKTPQLRDWFWKEVRNRKIEDREQL